MPFPRMRVHGMTRANVFPVAKNIYENVSMVLIVHIAHGIHHSLVGSLRALVIVGPNVQITEAMRIVLATSAVVSFHITIAKMPITSTVHCLPSIFFSSPRKTSTEKTTIHPTEPTINCKADSVSVMSRNVTAISVALNALMPQLVATGLFLPPSVLLI